MSEARKIRGSNDLPQEGPIRAISRERSIDRSGERLALFWEVEPDAEITPVATAKRSGLAETARGTPLTYLGSGKGRPWKETIGGAEVVMVIVPEEQPDRAVEALQAAADAGQRVYVLAPPGFGEGQKNHGLGERRDARVLIRRLPGIPVGAVVGGRGQQAGLWLDPASRWWLDLIPAQGEALFRIALNLFWYEAQDEAWTTGAPLQFQKAGARPFDVPRPGQDAPLRLLDPANAGLPPGEWNLVNAPGDKSGSNAIGGDGLELLLRTPRTQEMAHLAELVTAGVTVAWDDPGLPPMALANGGGQALLSGEGMRPMQLRLDELQAAALTGILRQVAEYAPRRLRTDTALGDVGGEVMLPDEEQPAPLQQRQLLDEGVHDAPDLEQMPALEPGAWSTPDARALKVVHTWTVKPPVAPGKARADRLLAQWAAAEKAFRSRLGQAGQSLKDSRQQHLSIGKRFKALASELLGFGRSRDRFEQRLAELEAEALTDLDPEEASARVARLEDLEQEIGLLSKQMEDTAEKQRLKEEEEKQQRAWEEARSRAKKQVPSAEQELTNLGTELTELDRKLAELGDSSALDSKAKKKRKQQERGIRTNQNRLNKKIEEQERALEALQAQVEESFEFKPTVKPTRKGKKGAGSALFVPAPARGKKLVIPPESLPTVGSLLTVKRGTKWRRYLAIECWEDLESGTMEAERLGARLVAANPKKGSKK